MKKDRLLAITPLLVAFMLVCILACRQSSPNAQNATRPEDKEAKQALQGIWMDADAGTPAFRAEGDTLYYPDSISQPAFFMIVADTLIVHGTKPMKYPILKQTEHLFRFLNLSGEEVKLVKSDTPDDDMSYFDTPKAVTINLNESMKHDTTVVFDGSRYYSSISVEPTNQKVVRDAYNADGMQVDNVYYDNMVYLRITRDNHLIISRHFSKKEFARHVPHGFLKQGILRDLIFTHIDDQGLHFSAEICQPDNPGSYEVGLVVNRFGKYRAYAIN